MSRLIATASILIVAVIIGLRLSDMDSISPASLTIKRIKPSGSILRGKPLKPVRVVLELVNTTNHVINLAPLQISCSC